MVKIEDWEARLILRIMNLAAYHYPKTVSKDTFSDIEHVREKLEGYVGTVTNKVD